MTTHRSNLPPKDDALSSPRQRAELERALKVDIDEYCQNAYGSGHRTHLGASIIGHDCPRYLWSVFRWLKAEKHSSRQLRLFRRGHLEESRFEEYLKGIGAEVIALQPDTKRQYKMKSVMGHLGGSLDGQISLPEKYGIPFGLLSEYKTKRAGNGFNRLKEKGVKLAAPQHYAQMCMYGEAYKYKYGLYMCVNKNDDDLHIEVIELDWRLAEEMKRKAYDIITAQIPPQKIAKNPAYYICKFCNFKDICFGNESAEINCRSCVHAKAIENGKWHCDVYGKVIPSDYIPKGCAKHEPIV